MGLFHCFGGGWLESGSEELGPPSSPFFPFGAPEKPELSQEKSGFLVQPKAARSLPSFVLLLRHWPPTKERIAENDLSGSVAAWDCRFAAQLIECFQLKGRGETNSSGGKRWDLREAHCLLSLYPLFIFFSFGSLALLRTCTCPFWTLYGTYTTHTHS